MLNRIRRAASLTRARHSAKGRHRRPLPAVQAPAAFFTAPAEALTAIEGRSSSDGDRCHPLAAEDVALVRPYVLTWEKRARTRTVVVAPRLPIHAWPALAGVH